ncbi:anthranilate synthase / indole-3-glycerol phosphate synthase [Dimargaris xerosporica]|nr:anthranilate synthase / indole-3-glycerol phosphate synthase [Dimargaris xerosporica]
MATILIDNYDSFTWNVYQYLAAAGAHVQVFRNDQTTLDHIISLNPVNIVLSPGPGFPGERTGICEDVLRHFQGKIPVLGVCLGQQIMYETYGGKVDLAGELFHGKVSPIQHDGKGIFKDIPQGITVTRYHSLAGHPPSCPLDELEVSSWTDNGLIMAVRHRTFTITGVQFHPESILSDYGQVMVRNFLNLRGGTWADNPADVMVSDFTPLPQYNMQLWKPAASTTGVANSSASGSSDPQSSILARIHRQRLLDVQKAKQLPGKSAADLEAQVSHAQHAFPTIDVVERIQSERSQTQSLAVMAEVKRASPSKGLIQPNAVAADEGLGYAKAGAAVISVLTEPTWFKGSLDDLKQVRQIIHSLPNRPALLRKDFIFDPYQIMEARIHGADTILLIVAMFAPDNDTKLRELMAYSRQLGMEPLVEVNSVPELQRALAVGANFIGANNRNLHTFKTDLTVSEQVAAHCPKGVTIAALSGIHGPLDVASYKQSGRVHAVLVGEALMKAANKAEFINGLIHGR